MKKVKVNSLCPCGSKIKYKKCCQKYHLGALASNALLLMRSRYSAYAVGDAGYIIKTTHKENIDYSSDTKQWIFDINLFCKDTEFIYLKILDYEESEDEAYVTFEANLSSSVMLEKSHFVKEDKRWLYRNAL